MKATAWILGTAQGGKLIHIIIHFQYNKPRILKYNENVIVESLHKFGHFKYWIEYHMWNKHNNKKKMSIISKKRIKQWSIEINLNILNAGRLIYLVVDLILLGLCCCKLTIYSSLSPCTVVHEVNFTSLLWFILSYHFTFTYIHVDLLYARWMANFQYTH